MDEKPRDERTAQEFDEKCPVHGSLKVRGAMLQGTVVKRATPHTVTVEVHYAKKMPKYERLEKRRRRIHVHVPKCLNPTEGEHVTIRECRKLSKTKSFVLVKDAN